MIAGGVVAIARVEDDGRCSVVVLEPMMSTGLIPEVCSVMGVVEEPEPRTRGVLGNKVCPAIRYCDCEFVVSVCPSTTTGVGLGVLSRTCGETTGIVVRICEP